ncbi:MAG TPA: hypothetical protein PLJ29_06250, partial [Leptospiraceae bacterium]|nr:hypothetical protein [Leptospiraceae bacterium]
MFTNLREALEFSNKTRQPELDLGNLDLRGNEPELEKLKTFDWVETLIFSNAQEDFEDEEEDFFPNKGKPNRLAFLPAYPPRLKQL